MRKLLLLFNAQKLLYLLLACCVSFSLNAQLATYTFDPGGTNASTTVAANVTAANAEFGALNTDVGFSAGNSGFGYGARNWPLGGLSGNRYLEFTLTADPGFTLDVSSISFEINRDNFGPSDFSVIIADNLPFAPNKIYGGAINIPITASSSWESFTFSEVSSGEVIRIRVFGTNANSSIGNLRFDNVVINGITRAANPPTSTCDDPIELTTTNCGMGINPNTPSGLWGQLPASGIQTLGFGFPGGASLPVDFNCLMDDSDAVGDLEIRLASSAFVSGPNPCFQYLENVYDVRDSDLNEALELVTVLVEFTGCSSDSEAPVVTCAEFTATFSGCPAGLGPNTPSGMWFAVPASGIIQTAVGGAFITAVDLNGCVTDNISNFGDLEWELVSSFEENRVPGCSVDLINEIGIRDACENEAMTTIIVRNTIQDDVAPVVTCTDFTGTFSGCPAGLGANTPTGVWIPIGTDGGFTAFSGGSFSIPVDLTTCVTDNCTDLADLEFTLDNSFEENRTDCQVTLVNEFAIRDACGTVAADRVTTRITIQDDEAPQTTCNDISITLAGAPSYALSQADIDAIGAGTTDNCGIDATSITVTPNTFTAADAGDNMVTYSVSDNCGNTATCTAIVSVGCELTVDCSNLIDQALECRADLPSVDFDLPIIVDSCGDVILSALTIIPGNSGCPGDPVIIPRTYFIQDAGGNMDQCTQTFTIESVIEPTISCPADVTLTCTDDTNPTSTGMATGTVSCGFTPVITFSDASTQTTIGCSQFDYIITRTWTIEDGCGRTETCDQIITVEDNDAPVVTCPEITMTFSGCSDPLGPNTPSGNWVPVPASGTFLTAVGGSFITPIDLTGCVTDNCGNLGDLEWTLISSFEENRVSGCSVDLINEIGIRDACENEAVTTIIVRNTIQDDEAPTVTCTDFTSTQTGCPDGLGANTPNGVWVPVGADGGFTAASGGSFSIPVDLTSCVTDNCTDLADLEITLHSSYEENRTSCAVTLVNEFSVRDACENIAADRVITRITIQDDEAPTVTCADFTSIQTGCSNGLGPNTPDGVWIRVGSDGGFTAASGGSFTIPVDLTTCVSDNCSDLADLEFTLDSSYEENRTSCQVTLVNEFLIRDECGNISADRVITKITIQDDEAPVVACIEFIETFNRCPDQLGPNTPSGSWQPVPASGLLLTAVGGSSIGTMDLNCITDNCSPVGELEVRLTRSFEENRVPGCSVDILNEYEVRDACGNVSPDLILFRGQIRFDGPPPVLTAPIAFPLECGMPSDPSVTGMATATSGCGTPTVTFSDQSAPGPCGLSEIITRTWLATDGCGKTSDATQLIVITDNTPPTIVQAPDVTVNCDDDTTPTGTGTPTATDVCSAGPPTVTFADDVRLGNCPGNFTIRRTWTATDECANSASYLQIITVQDIEGPVFAEAPGDLDAALTNVALDAFGTGLCLTTLDASALEAAINAALTASATGVTGIDFPTPTDACSAPITNTATVIINPATAACLALIDITYTSTDACMNSSTYAQQLSVTDVAPPVLITPAPDVTVECDMPTDVTATGSPIFEDECLGAVVSIVNADVEVADPTCPNGKTITRTFTATDPCGNTSVQVQVITVVDTQAPVYTSFPRDTTIECSSLSGMRNEQAIILTVVNAQGLPVVEDNCSVGLAAPFTDAFMLSTDCPTVGIFERIFAAIDDGCGNILPARTLTITVIDTLAPIFTSIPLGGDFDCAVGIPPVGTATAVDCDPNVVVTEVDDVTIVGVNQLVSITERTITATDFCGNETSQVETYRVFDQDGPFLISCPDDIGPIVARPDDMAFVSFATPVFDDNCSFSVSGTHMSGQDFPVGLTQIVYTAVDGGGNFTECAFTIEVVKALNLTCLDQRISIDDANDLTRADINFPFPATDCDACPQGEPLPSLDYLGYFQGHRYYVSAPGDTRSWTEAQRHAVSLGGRLVEVNSPEENRFLQRELPYDNALIGHSTGPRSTTWTGTFSPVIFENWAQGFPTTGTNEFFALLDATSGTHTNVNHSEKPFIVEFPCVEFEVVDMPANGLFDQGTNCVIFEAIDQCGNRDTCHYTFGVNTFNVNYCGPSGASFGNEEDYFITGVSIGAFAKTLDASSSFYQLRDTVELVEDVATTISVSAETSGMEGASFPSYWRVWVDANQDGDFYDNGEMIYQAFGDAANTGSITLPSSLTSVSPTRIRVAFSRFNFPEPCGENPFGAVVDFSLKSNSTVLPRLALTGASGQGMNTLTITSDDGPEIHAYQLLRGASPDDLTKLDFWSAIFGNNDRKEFVIDDLDPMFSAYYQAVALGDQGQVIRTSNVVQLTLPVKRDPVLVFPNPAVHELYIDFGHGQGGQTSPSTNTPKGEILLYDPLGRVIQTQSFDTNVKRVRMGLPRLAAGTYIIRVNRPNKLATNVRIMIDQSGSSYLPGS